MLLLYLFRSRMSARKKEMAFSNAQLGNYTRALIKKSELIEELKAEAEHFKTAATGPDHVRAERVIAERRSNLK